MKNDPQILQSVVDELATIKAHVDGTLHRVTVCHVSGRVCTDWKTIAEKFDPSRQLVQAHTTQGAAYVSLKITSRG